MITPTQKYRDAENMQTVLIQMQRRLDEVTREMERYKLAYEMTEKRLLEIDGELALARAEVKKKLGNTRGPVAPFWQC